MASIDPGAEGAATPVAPALGVSGGADLGATYATRVLRAPGLPTAVVVDMPQAHSAIVQVFVRAGSAFETPETNGISHFIEHVVLAGTERFPTRPLLQRAIDATGGFLDAVTHKELTEYSFQVEPGQVARALELLGEALTRPSFSADAVESERKIVLEEMITGNYEGAKDPFTEILWGTDSVGLPIIGTREVVEALTPADLRKHWREAYTLASLLVCVAGRVAIADVERGLEAFRGLSDGQVRRPRAARGQRAVEIQIERYPSSSLDACLMLRTPGWETQDRSLHTVLYLITQHYQTHVYEELVGPELPVYYLYAGQETFITEGYIYFYFNVSRERFFTTLERVIEAIDRLRRDGISEQALEINRRRYELSVVANLDDPRDVAYRVGAYLLLCGPERAVSIEEELSQVAALDVRRVREVIAEIFTARNLCVIARGGISWWQARKLRKRLAAWLEDSAL